MLCEWDLGAMAQDAEIIVGELAANAITHSATSGHDGQPCQQNLSLCLRRQPGDVICAVLDPSTMAPVPSVPRSSGHCGRGLQIVDALIDVWGWSPIIGRGKAVRAVLSHRSARPTGSGKYHPQAGKASAPCPRRS
jgi:two-component sensor histidine kinase